jgi:hypothetical protein
MRRVRYAVVMSLDGYIAGPKGEADWITTDPEFDFTAVFSQFDTLLVGRATFDKIVAAGRPSMPGMRTIVFSRTLRQEDHPGVTILTDGQREMLAALKTSRGKDIWLFGGGSYSAVSPQTDWSTRLKSRLSQSFSVREFRCCRTPRTGSNYRSGLTKSTKQASCLWSAQSRKLCRIGTP